MNTLFTICFLLIVAWLIFGLVNPKKALGFLKDDSRKTKTTVLVAAFAAFAACTVIFKPSFRKQSQTTQPSTSVETTQADKAKADSLQRAQNALKEELRKEDSATIVKLKPFFDEEKDEFDANGGYWVYPKERPKSVRSNGVYCYFYMNKNGKPSNLRFVFQYCDDSWLFIKSLQIKADKAIMTYKPRKVERDNGSSKVWEWFDENKQQNHDVNGVVYNIAYAKTVKIRIQGQKYYKDITLNDKQIQSMKNTIDYYRALGGEL